MMRWIIMLQFFEEGDANDCNEKVAGFWHVSIVPIHQQQCLTNWNDENPLSCLTFGFCQTF